MDGPQNDDVPSSPPPSSPMQSLSINDEEKEESVRKDSDVLDGNVPQIAHHSEENGSDLMHDVPVNDSNREMNELSHPFEASLPSNYDENVEQTTDSDHHVEHPFPNQLHSASNEISNELHPDTDSRRLDNASGEFDDVKLETTSNSEENLGHSLSNEVHSASNELHIPDTDGPMKSSSLLNEEFSFTLPSTDPTSVLPADNQEDMSFDFNKVDVADDPFAHHDSEDPFGDFTAETAQSEGLIGGNDDPFGDFVTERVSQGTGADDWDNFGGDLASSSTFEQPFESSTTSVVTTENALYSSVTPLLHSSTTSEQDITNAVVYDLNNSGFSATESSPIESSTEVKSLCDRARDTVGAQLFLGADGEVQSVTARRKKQREYERLLYRAVGATEDRNHRRNIPAPGMPPILQQLFEKEMMKDRQTDILSHTQKNRLSALADTAEAEETRMLLEKLEQMEQALEEEQRALEEQQKRIEIEHREAELHPELEEEVMSNSNTQGGEDKWTRQMKEKGGLEQRTKDGTVKLLKHTQLPPPMTINSFFRSPSQGNTPNQSPVVTALTKATKPEA